MRRNYLGLALVVGMASLGAGGVIAALYREAPSDQAITAITALLATIAGGLIGHQINKGGDDREK